MPDIVVAGGGLVGLCVATALAERKLEVVVVSEPRLGEASRAAAGMLAPSIERATGPAHDFGIAARDRYPSYVEFLAERTGIRVPLNRDGILQVALNAQGVKGLRRAASPGSVWIEAAALAEMEPALSHALGAVHNPLDGAVDNVALFGALEALVAKTENIRVEDDLVVNISPAAGSVKVTTMKGQVISAGFAVIAAGAWSAQIGGARLAGAVAPLKGQLVAYAVAPVRHVAYGPRGYLVPRGNSTIAGSTMERTGFDPTTSVEGVTKVRSAAAEICPALARSEVTGRWGGLRPATPDMLPLLGPDPKAPRIIYACGHSRNGVLMAPLTGDLIADLVTGSPLRHDLSQFRPDRF
jgi:glycine oxidase ThiO